MAKSGGKGGGRAANAGAGTNFLITVTLDQLGQLAALREELSAVLEELREDVELNVTLNPDKLKRQMRDALKEQREEERRAKRQRESGDREVKTPKTKIKSSITHVESPDGVQVKAAYAAVAVKTTSVITDKAQIVATDAAMHVDEADVHAKAIDLSGSAIVIKGTSTKPIKLTGTVQVDGQVTQGQRRGTQRDPVRRERGSRTRERQAEAVTLSAGFEAKLLAAIQKGFKAAGSGEVAAASDPEVVRQLGLQTRLLTAMARSMGVKAEANGTIQRLNRVADLGRDPVRGGRGAQAHGGTYGVPKFTTPKLATAQLDRQLQRLKDTVESVKSAVGATSDAMRTVARTLNSAAKRAEKLADEVGTAGTRPVVAPAADQPRGPIYERGEERLKPVNTKLEAIRQGRAAAAETEGATLSRRKRDLHRIAESMGAVDPTLAGRWWNKKEQAEWQSLTSDGKLKSKAGRSAAADFLARKMGQLDEMEQKLLGEKDKVLAQTIAHGMGGAGAGRRKGRGAAAAQGAVNAAAAAVTPEADAIARQAAERLVDLFSAMARKMGVVFDNSVDKATATTIAENFGKAPVADAIPTGAPTAKKERKKREPRVGTVRNDYAVDEASIDYMRADNLQAHLQEQNARDLAEIRVRQKSEASKKARDRQKELRAEQLEDLDPIMRRLVEAERQTGQVPFRTGGVSADVRRAIAAVALEDVRTRKQRLQVEAGTEASHKDYRGTLRAGVDWDAENDEEISRNISAEMGNFARYVRERNPERYGEFQSVMQRRDAAREATAKARQRVETLQATYDEQVALGRDPEQVHQRHLADLKAQFERAAAEQRAVEAQYEAETRPAVRMRMQAPGGALFRARQKTTSLAALRRSLIAQGGPTAELIDARKSLGDAEANERELEQARQDLATSLDRDFKRDYAREVGRRQAAARQRAQTGQTHGLLESTVTGLSGIVRTMRDRGALSDDAGVDEGELAAQMREAALSIDQDPELDEEAKTRKRGEQQLAAIRDLTKRLNSSGARRRMDADEQARFDAIEEALRRSDNDPAAFQEQLEAVRGDRLSAAQESRDYEYLRAAYAYNKDPEKQDWDKADERLRKELEQDPGGLRRLAAEQGIKDLKTADALFARIRNAPDPESDTKLGSLGTALTELDALRQRSPYVDRFMKDAMGPGEHYMKDGAVFSKTSAIMARESVPTPVEVQQRIRDTRYEVGLPVTASFNREQAQRLEGIEQRLKTQGFEGQLPTIEAGGRSVEYMALEAQTNRRLRSLVYPARELVENLAKGFGPDGVPGSAEEFAEYRRLRGDGSTPASKLLQQLMPEIPADADRLSQETRRAVGAALSNLRLLHDELATMGKLSQEVLNQRPPSLPKRRTADGWETISPLDRSLTQQERDEAARKLLNPGAFFDEYKGVTPKNGHFGFMPYNSDQLRTLVAGLDKATKDLNAAKTNNERDDAKFRQWKYSEGIRMGGEYYVPDAEGQFGGFRFLPGGKGDITRAEWTELGMVEDQKLLQARQRRVSVWNEYHGLQDKDTAYAAQLFQELELLDRYVRTGKELQRMRRGGVVNWFMDEAGQSRLQELPKPAFMDAGKAAAVTRVRETPALITMAEVEAAARAAEEAQAAAARRRAEREVAEAAIKPRMSEIDAELAKLVVRTEKIPEGDPRETWKKEGHIYEPIGGGMRTIWKGDEESVRRRAYLEEQKSILKESMPALAADDARRAEAGAAATAQEAAAEAARLRAGYERQQAEVKAAFDEAERQRQALYGDPDRLFRAAHGKGAFTPIRTDLVGGMAWQMGLDTIAFNEQRRRGAKPEVNPQPPTPEPRLNVFQLWRQTAGFRFTREGRMAAEGPKVPDPIATPDVLPGAGAPPIKPPSHYSHAAAAGGDGPVPPGGGWGPMSPEQVQALTVALRELNALDMSDITKALQLIAEAAKTVSNTLRELERNELMKKGVRANLQTEAYKEYLLWKRENGFMGEGAEALSDEERAQREQERLQRDGMREAAIRNAAERTQAQLLAREARVRAGLPKAEHAATKADRLMDAYGTDDEKLLKDIYGTQFRQVILDPEEAHRVALANKDVEEAAHARRKEQTDSKTRRGMAALSRAQEQAQREQAEKDKAQRIYTAFGTTDIDFINAAHNAGSTTRVHDPMEAWQLALNADRLQSSQAAARARRAAEKQARDEAKVTKGIVGAQYLHSSEQLNEIARQQIEEAFAAGTFTDQGRGLGALRQFAKNTRTAANRLSTRERRAFIAGDAATDAQRRAVSEARMDLDMNQELLTASLREAALQNPAVFGSYLADAVQLSADANKRRGLERMTYDLERNEQLILNADTPDGERQVANAEHARLVNELKSKHGLDRDQLPQAITDLRKAEEERRNALVAGLREDAEVLRQVRLQATLDRRRERAKAGGAYTMLALTTGGGRAANAFEAEELFGMHRPDGFAGRRGRRNMRDWVAGLRDFGSRGWYGSQVRQSTNEWATDSVGDIGQYISQRETALRNFRVLQQKAKAELAKDGDVSVETLKRIQGTRQRIDDLAMAVASVVNEGLEIAPKFFKGFTATDLAEYERLSGKRQQYEGFYNTNRLLEMEIGEAGITDEERQRRQDKFDAHTRDMYAATGFNDRNDLVNGGGAARPGIRELIAQEKTLEERIMGRAEAMAKANGVMQRQGLFVDRLANKFATLSMYLGPGFFLYSAISQIGMLLGEVGRLEKAMADVQGVLVSKSMSDRLKIEDGVIRAAKEYGVAISEVAHTAKTFAQTGASPDQAIQLTRGALLGTTAAGLEGQQSTEMLIAVDNLSRRPLSASTASDARYRIDMGDELGISPTDILDRISLIEARNAVTAQDLSVGLQRVGALAMQLQPQAVGGIDAFDSVIAMVTQLVETQRVTGNAAATSLRFMISRLSAPDIAAKLQKDYGIALAADPGGKEMRPLMDIMTDIATRYKDLSAEGRTLEANELLGTFAGARQINAASVLFRDWDKVMGTAQASSLAFGDTMQRLAIQQETLGFKTQRMQNAVVEFTNLMLRSTGAMSAAKWVMDAGTGFFEALSGSRQGDEAQRAATPGLTTLATGGLSILAGLGIGALAPKLASGGGMVGLLGDTVKNLGRFGFYISRLLTPLGLLLSVLGALAAYKGFKDFQARKGDAYRDQYGVNPIDPAVIRDSDMAKNYASEARKLFTTPDDLRDKIASSMETAMQTVAERHGVAVDAIYNEGTRTYTSPSIRQETEREFTNNLRGMLPELARVGDEAEQTAVALQLLRDSAIYSGAMQSTALSELQTKLQDAMSRMVDRSAMTYNAVAPKSREDYVVWAALRRAPTSQAEYDAVLAANQSYLNSPAAASKENVALRYGFAYNAVVADMAYQQTDKDRATARAADGSVLTWDLTKVATDIKSVLSHTLLGSTTLADAVGRTTVTGRDGGSTTIYAEAARLITQHGKTLGEALDEVTSNLLSYGKDQQAALDKATIEVSRDPNVRTAAERQAAIRAALTAQGTEASKGALATMGRREEFDAKILARLQEVFNMDERLKVLMDAQGGSGSAQGGSRFLQEMMQSIQRGFQTMLENFDKNGQTEQARIIRMAMAGMRDVENNPRYMAALDDATKPSSKGLVRDRILDVLIRYMTQREEIDYASPELLRAGIGVDQLSERAGASQQLLRGLFQARSEIYGDLMRAYSKKGQWAEMEALLRSRTTLRGMGMEEGDSAERRQAGEVFRTAVVGMMSEADPAQKKALQTQIDVMEQALQDIASNVELFEHIPERLRDRLRAVLQTPFGDERNRQLVLAFQDLVDAARELAKADTMLIAMREREQRLTAIQQEQVRTRLQAAVDARRQARDTGAQLAEVAGGRAGGVPVRRQNVRLDTADELAMIRLRAQQERQQLELDRKAGKADAVGEFYTNRRLEIDATRTRDTEAAMLRQQQELQKMNDAVRVEAASQRKGANDALLGSLTGAFAETFSSGMRLKELYARDENGNRQLTAALLGPLASAVQERVSQNFFENLMGPESPLGKKLSGVFDQDALMRRETLRLEALTIRQAHIDGITQGFVAAQGGAHVKGLTQGFDGAGAGPAVLGGGLVGAAAIAEAQKIQQQAQGARLTLDNSWKAAAPLAPLMSAGIMNAAGRGSGTVIRSVDDALAKYAGNPHLTRELATKIFDGATQRGLNPDIVFAQLYQESRFNATALGKPTKYGQARGIGQMLPGTAKGFGLSEQDLYDVDKALPASLDYMAANKKIAGGDEWKALALYFGGGDEYANLNLGAVPNHDPDKLIEHLRTHPRGHKFDFDEYVATIVRGARTFPTGAAQRPAPGTYVPPSQRLDALIGSTVSIAALRNGPAMQWTPRSGVAAEGVVGATHGPLEFLANADQKFTPEQVQSMYAQTGWNPQQLAEVVAAEAAFKKAQGDAMKGQLGMMVGNVGGGLIASQMNGGNNHGDIGASLGSLAGMAIGGPVGAAVGGLLGGALGGLFKKKSPKADPVYTVMEKIERNTRETITTIENQTRRMADLDARMLNVPASFVVPNHRPMTVGAGNPALQGGDTTTNITINVHGNEASAEEIANTVVRQINREMARQGQYVSKRGG